MELTPEKLTLKKIHGCSISNKVNYDSNVSQMKNQSEIKNFSLQQINEMK